jgi:hypothetical protein
VRRSKLKHSKDPKLLLATALGMPLTPSLQANPKAAELLLGGIGNAFAVGAGNLPRAVVA